MLGGVHVGRSSVTDVLVEPFHPTFRIEDGSDRLSQNVGKRLPTDAT